MMSDIPDDLMRDLLKTFQVEAAEHLQTLNQALLKIEREEEDAPRRHLVQEAFRAAHSLKGAARSVDLHDIEQVAHGVENVLQQARDNGATLAPEVCDVLYASLDHIQQMLAGQSVDVAALQARLGEVTGAPEQSSMLEAGVSAAASVKGEATSAQGVSDETIRIAVSKLDELMAQTGELLISKINAEQRLSDLTPMRQQLARWPVAWREIKTMLRHVDGETGQRLQGALAQHYETLQALTRRFDAFEQALKDDALRLGMVATDLQDDVRRARMLPFHTITLGLERGVRDAARGEAKQIAFSIEGSDTELDRKVLEALKDPLLHLLSNAVSHGIEAPEERQAAGKPAEGRIKLVVTQRGSEVSLLVSDDGRGFDLAALRQSHQAGAASDLDEGNPDDAITLAFLPGITTAQRVTPLSGRGVGLDVVRRRVKDIHGRIAVDNRPGRGASIELIVPSSLTMTRGLVVRCGSQHFVLPLLSIERIVEVRETVSIGGKQMLRIEQTTLPLVPLDGVLGLPPAANGHGATPLAVIISVADQRLALLVDEVLSELELAVKPLGEPLRRVRNVIGAALLGTGEPIVILNPGDLVQAAQAKRFPELRLEHAHQDDAQQCSGHILVVDDSITTRTLEKNILEAAGYQVTIAVDGLEALKRLKADGIDLVVTDIQMPNMDGIALTQQIRETASFKGLPVILVTSLENQEDREKGMLAGADAYIVKRGFNQAVLLTTIKQFLEKAS